MIKGPGTRFRSQLASRDPDGSRNWASYKSLCE